MTKKGSVPPASFGFESFFLKRSFFSLARSCSIVEFPRLKISRNLGLSSGFDLDARWQRERSDNRDYTTIVVDDLALTLSDF